MSGIDSAVLSQYEALNNGAGVVRLAGRTLLEISGADRVNFIHSFCTNDVKRLQAGQGCEAFFTNHQGKTVGHGLLFAQENSLLFETTAGQAAALIQHLDRFVISERVEFHDRSSQRTELFVGGSKAGDVLSSLVAGNVPETMLSHQAAQIAGQPVALRRVGFTTALGWLVEVDLDGSEVVRSSLIERGATEVGEEVFDICRLEAGWPMFGKDVTEQNLPQEINRNEQAISFKKGCYLGQETVARLDALGHVNRLLVGVKILGEAIPSAGSKLLQGEKEFGEITSSNWSPTLRTPLAMALVRRTASSPGTALALAGHTAVVVGLPLAQQQNLLNK